MSGALFALQGHCVLRRGKACRLSPHPFLRYRHSASAALRILSLDEAEHFPSQSRCQRRYAPMVFGIIPERRSASLRKSVQLHRNPQTGSLLNINEYFTGVSKWDDREIEQRQDGLAKAALEVWKL